MENANKKYIKRNSMIPEDRQKSLSQKTDQTIANKNGTKDKHRTHNTTLKAEAGVTHPYKIQDEFRCSGMVSNTCSTRGTRRVTQYTKPV